MLARGLKQGAAGSTGTLLAIAMLAIAPPESDAQIGVTCVTDPPGAASPQAPADGAAIGGNTVNFAYSVAGFPDKYELSVVTRPPFDSPVFWDLQTFSSHPSYSFPYAGYYTWQVRGLCNFGQTGPWSVARTFALYPTPPGAISSVNVIDCSTNSLELSWYAPATVLHTPVASYEIRESLEPIDDTNWSSATVVPNPPAPSSVNTLQTFWVPNLSSCTTYYVAIKSSDPALQWSAVSNMAGGRTRCSSIGPCGTLPLALAPTHDAPSAAVPFEISRVSPVPARSTCTIDYTVPSASELDISVFDIAGRRVATIVHRLAIQGSGRASWDLRDSAGGRVRSGMYMVRALWGDQVRTRSLLILE